MAGLRFFVLVLGALQCISCCSHDADIFTPIYRRWPLAVLRTKSSKVKRVSVARLFLSTSIRELTTASCFDILAG